MKNDRTGFVFDRFENDRYTYVLNNPRGTVWFEFDVGPGDSIIQTELRGLWRVPEAQQMDRKRFNHQITTLQAMSTYSFQAGKSEKYSSELTTQTERNRGKVEEGRYYVFHSESVDPSAFLVEAYTYQKIRAEGQQFVQTIKKVSLAFN